MTVQNFPGDLRIGVLNEHIVGVENPTPSDVLPKLQLLVLLNGYQTFELGGREIVLDAEGRKAAAVIMLVSQAVTLRYVASRGAPLRKIALAAPHHWLDALPNERSSQIAGQIASPAEPGMVGQGRICAVSCLGPVVGHLPLGRANHHAATERGRTPERALSDVPGP